LTSQMFSPLNLGHRGNSLEHLKGKKKRGEKESLLKNKI